MDMDGCFFWSMQFSGALACWDFAATAGHLRPNLNPPTQPGPRYSGMTNIDAEIFQWDWQEEWKKLYHMSDIVYDIMYDIM